MLLLVRAAMQYAGIMSPLPILAFLILPLAAGARPTLEEVRQQMGRASVGDVRGQRDTVGYAATAEASGDSVENSSAQGMTSALK